MNRRTFLRAAIAIPVAALVPELPAGQSVVITGSVSGPHVVPLEGIVFDEYDHILHYSRYVGGLRTWHDGEKMNAEWISLQELYGGPHDV